MVTATLPVKCIIYTVIPPVKWGPFNYLQNCHSIRYALIVTRQVETIAKDPLFGLLTNNDLSSELQQGILNYKSCILCHSNFFDVVTLNADW